MKSISLFALLFFLFRMAFAQCNELFISEYCEGSYNNKALEIFNPSLSPVSLSSYRLVRWSNGNATFDPLYAVTLNGTIAASDAYVMVLDKRNPAGTGTDTMVAPALQAYADTFASPDYNINKMCYFNGNDALTLEKYVGANWNIIDIFGKIGEDPGPGTAWTDAYPYNDNQGTWLTMNHTLIRKSSVQQGVTVNPTAFNTLAEWDTLPNQTWTNLGMHTCSCPVGIEEKNLKAKISVYPDMASGKIFIYSSSVALTAAEIHTLYGQKISSFTADNPMNTIVMNFRNFSSGIYFVKVFPVNNAPVESKVLLREQH